MAYKENPNFPSNPVENIPVNDSKFRNLDLFKIEETLQEIKANQTGSGTAQPVSEFFTLTIPSGSIGVSKDFSTFSIPNIQEGDTGSIFVTLQDAQGTSILEIKPGVIYNFPYIQGRTIRVDEIENTGLDEKQFSGILV